jgi:hypothetical protein
MERTLTGTKGTKPSPENILLAALLVARVGTTKGAWSGGVRQAFADVERLKSPKSSMEKTA